MPKAKKAKPHNHDNTALWLNNGLNIEARKLRLMGDIDSDALESVLSGLEVLNSLGHEPITLYLNTMGGDEVPGLAIYDAIKASPAPVSIVVVGAAFSMGAIILQAAKHRALLPSSALMVHVGDRAYEGHAENVRREMLFDKDLDEMCDRILLERMQEVDPELTLGRLRDMLTLDTYFPAEKAVSQGLADEVVW